MQPVMLNNDFFDLKNMKIFLYGASSGGISCLNYLGSLGMADNVVGFVDGDVTKWGTCLCDRHVGSMEDIVRNPSALVVITCSFYREIFEAIRNAGCENPVFADIDFQPQLEGKPLTASPEEVESLFDPADMYTKNIIKTIYFSRNASNCRIQPVLNVMDISPSLTYWYEERSELTRYDALTICDAGAYTGDSLCELFGRYGERIASYHAFEPDGSNFLVLEGTVAKHVFKERITPHNCGLGNKNGTIGFQTDCGSLMRRVTEVGDTTIQIKRLDDLFLDITGQLCIKMDIEGSELDALEGARNTIRREGPDLAICTYHRPNDILEIPKYIKSLNPQYKCVLRGGNHMVCYARVRDNS